MSLELEWSPSLVRVNGIQPIIEPLRNIENVMIQYSGPVSSTEVVMPFPDLTKLSRTEGEAMRKFQILLELSLRGQVFKKGALDNIDVLTEEVSRRLPQGKTAAQIIREVREEE